MQNFFALEKDFALVTDWFPVSFAFYTVSVLRLCLDRDEKFCIFNSHFVNFALVQFLTGIFLHIH